MPIYQTTAYVFRDADHAAALFGLQEVGYIYSRLTNPTIGALQNRIAALEGGAGAVCCSSGHAAQITSPAGTAKGLSANPLRLSEAGSEGPDVCQ